MRVGILMGNGFGPEITRATQQVPEATGLPLEWKNIPIANEAVELYGHPLPPETVARLRAVGNTIKAPLIVNKLQDRISCVQPNRSTITYPSLNNAIRRELGLFVNPQLIKGFPGVSGRHEDLDAVIMREVTEDVYIGHEHSIGDYIAAEAIKLTTRVAATRVCYGLVPSDDMMIDAACYAIVRDSKRFDIVVTSNQYGDIFSDLAAGLAGSLGQAAAFREAIRAVVARKAGLTPDLSSSGTTDGIASAVL